MRRPGGILTWHGSAAEFKILDRWLATVWDRLAELGSEPVLVAIPGNHDLMRPSPKGAAVKALGAWHVDADIRGEFWSEPEGDYRRCVGTAFAPYAAWAERQPAMKRSDPRWGALPGDVAAVLDQGGLRVGVVGLNSAFLQLTGADYERKLDLDVRQLHAACGGDAPAWLKQNDLNLLLTHHPPSWLEPQRLKGHFETEIAPPGRFALHLHGHLHEPNAYAEAVGGSRPRHRLAGPSLFGLEHFERPGGVEEERIHGYTAGRIELAGGEATPGAKARARVRLWPRRLVTKKSGKRLMERDGEFELEADESFTFDVPCNPSAGASKAPRPSEGAELGVGSPKRAGQSAPGPTARQDVVPMAADAKRPASPCRVLFLASNPDAARRLDLGTEFRAVREEIERTGRGSLFSLELRPDLHLDDLRRSLNALSPSVVHFGGHGAGTSGLLLHDKAVGPRLVDAVALRGLFALTDERVRLVVLNACYSDTQARALVDVVDCVVGMTRAVEDEAACHFAAAFYGALASGRSVKNAFAQGIWAMRHGGVGGERGAGLTDRDVEAFARLGEASGGQNKPKLLVGEGVDAAKIVFAPPLQP